MSMPSIRSCDSAVQQAFVLKATVYPSKGSAGFVGYGDADPFNVSLRVRGAEMRMAETRAVNRALRKAYGVGICSIEEIGSFAGPIEPGPEFSEDSAEGRRTETATVGPQGTGPTLPDHPSAQARSGIRQGLRG